MLGGGRWYELDSAISSYSDPAVSSSALLLRENWYDWSNKVDVAYFSEYEHTSSSSLHNTSSACV